MTPDEISAVAAAKIDRLNARLQRALTGDPRTVLALSTRPEVKRLRQAIGMRPS